jgi:hypothetical protein
VKNFTNGVGCIGAIIYDSKCSESAQSGRVPAAPAAYSARINFTQVSPVAYIRSLVADAARYHQDSVALLYPPVQRINFSYLCRTAVCKQRQISPVMISPIKNENQKEEKKL